MDGGSDAEKRTGKESGQRGRKGGMEKQRNRRQ